MKEIQCGEGNDCGECGADRCARPSTKCDECGDCGACVRSNGRRKMMHHPNMHHQPMSGHPPQHLAGHQGMPGHHQMPPHQIHRENRHVTLTRVPLGPGAAGGGMGGMGGMGGPHGQAMGGMGLGVHHARPPHPIRAMHHPPHHPPPPQQMKPVRRTYMGGGYGGSVVPPYAPPEPAPAPAPPQHHTGLRRPTSPTLSAQSTLPPDFAATPGAPGACAGAGAGAGASPPGEGAGEGADAAPAPANSKEKTPMCLVNELARYNKIKHQYRLTSETGPAHKKVFTVTLRLGDTEEYTAEGSSIKRAQHAAAGAALAGTAFPPPPPRAPPAHPPAPPHHRHAVMPTVELNALAMKLCQPAVYTSVPPGPAPGRPRPQYRMPYLPPPYRGPAPHHIHRVRVCVGGRAWLGEGPTPQAARHDAAARALHDLRPQAAAALQPQPQHRPPDADTGANGDANVDLLNTEVKSPVSLVHELALKRNLSVQFTVKSEKGPPHMRVFVTACTVGDIETEGEGNGKKVSKRRAAERMLEEMRRRWPPALLRQPPHDRRPHPPAKKKPRNLIKEGGVAGGGAPSASGGGADNPISRLAVARHAVRARSPQYRVLEERGAARRREFLVQCDAPPHSATGLGPNKKTAKRRAAHNVLVAMEMAKEGDTNGAAATNGDATTNGGGDAAKNTSSDTKRKEGEGPGPTSGGANSEVRQPVPGVLMMDYHQRSGQPTQPNGVSEASAAAAAAGGGGSTPGAKDQLMYLSQLLGFTVQFSDFPKRNHGEYLSLVSLSTEPPVMCHGGGASTAHSHEQCARAALRALALMGLDAPPQPHQMPSMPGAGGKAAVSAGIAE